MVLSRNARYANWHQPCLGSGVHDSMTPTISNNVIYSSRLSIKLTPIGRCWGYRYGCHATMHGRSQSMPTTSYYLFIPLRSSFVLPYIRKNEGRIKVYRMEKERFCLVFRQVERRYSDVGLSTVSVGVGEPPLNVPSARIR